MLAAAVAVGGCSQLVNLDGLVGPVDASASDANITGDGGAGDDARDGAPDDAPDDARDDRGFCERSDAQFCDDFDQPARTVLASDGWTGLDMAAGGGSAIETALPRSLPRAAKFTWAANVPTGAECHYAGLHREATVTGSTIALAFAAWLGDAAGNLMPDDLLAHIAWGAADGTGCTVIWQSSPTGNELREQATSMSDTTHPLSAGQASGAWHDYKMSVDLSTGSLGFTVDGRNAFAAPVQLRSACLHPFVRVSMSIGFYCASSNPLPAEVRFDNVTFSAR